MRAPRKDNTINDFLEELDNKLVAFPTATGYDLPQAWASLDNSELEWIDQQIERCIFNRRYYLENYHLIRDEHGRVKTMYPFLDQQEMIYEALEKGWEKDGCFRGI